MVKIGGGHDMQRMAKIGVVADCIPTDVALRVRRSKVPSARVSQSLRG